MKIRLRIQDQNKQASDSAFTKLYRVRELRPSFLNNPCNLHKSVSIRVPLRWSAMRCAFAPLHFKPAMLRCLSV